MHLELPRTVAIGDRRMEPRGGRRERTHDDYRAHGQRLRRRLEEVRSGRRVGLHVADRRVVVLTFGRPVRVDVITTAGLVILDDTDPRSVVAMATEAELRPLEERIAAFEAGLGPDETRVSLHYEELVDSLDDVRPYGPSDRITARLGDQLRETAPDELVSVDIECWHPGDHEGALRILAALREGVAATGGEVTDTYHSLSAALVLARARVLASAVPRLAELEEIARIDDLPDAGLSDEFVHGFEVRQMPDVIAAAADAPIVGVVDSGVRSAHPLIAPSLVAALNVHPDVTDGEDETSVGHGTRIAGLVLYGRMETLIHLPQLPAPPCRVLSVRVLDATNFAHETLWESTLEAAVRECVARGATIVNLSVGDLDTPYRGARATPLAAVLDGLARELQIVIVVPTGNVHVPVYSELDQGLLFEYPLRLLAHADAALIDPAPAALALTVGGLAHRGVARHVAERPLGSDGWPSPITRHGPGIGGAVKPELAAPSGSLAWDADGWLASADGLSIMSTSARVAGRFFDFDIGTSYGVPLVSRAAAVVKARYPAFGPNLIRALVLQGVRPPRYESDLRAGTEGQRARVVRELVGYGELREVEAAESQDHRVVLYRGAEISANGVHIYRVPIPDSFFLRGGTRSVTVALAFDPPVRGRRLDYMAGRMQFYLLRGLTMADVEARYLRRAEEFQELLDAAAEEPEDANDPTDVIDEAEDVDGAAERPIPPRARGWNVVSLRPSSQYRSAGANQLGRVSFAQRLRRDVYGDDFVLVVKHVNRWDALDATQRYAVSVALERDEDSPPLYADLVAKIALRVELRA